MISHCNILEHDEVHPSLHQQSANSHQGEHEAQVGAADIVGHSFHELGDRHGWHGGRVEHRVLARLRLSSTIATG